MRPKRRKSHRKPSPVQVPLLSSRKLRRLKEEGASTREMVTEAYKSISQFLRESRLSQDAKRKALDLAKDEVEDDMARETVSWVENVGTRWPPAGKGREEDEDLD